MANRRKKPSKPTVPHRTSAEGCAATVTANRWRLELAKLVPSTHAIAPAECCCRLSESLRGCGDCRKGKECGRAECVVRRAGLCCRTLPRRALPRRLHLAARPGGARAAPRYRRRGRAEPAEGRDGGTVARHDRLSPLGRSGDGRPVPGFGASGGR